MHKVAFIGLDIAKEVFQLHAIDKAGVVLIKRKLPRAELVTYFRKLSPCTVGIESVASAHHWGRTLTALGHDVRLMSPNFVKPYVKSQKNDAADAEAICEAVQRPNMRFVAIKSREQQAIIALHTARDLLIRQQTMLINACRGCLSEFGIVGKIGDAGFAALIAGLGKVRESMLPASARAAVRTLAAQLRSARTHIRLLDAKIAAWHRSSEDSRRLATIPGIGVTTATALVAHIADPSQFESGRHFAVSLGLVPRQFSSGGKLCLGHITKRGNTRLRTLLVLGARFVVWRVRRGYQPPYAGLRELVLRKPFWIAVVALANKMARVVWALLSKRQFFQASAMA